MKNTHFLLSVHASVATIALYMLVSPAAARKAEPQTAWEASRTVDDADMVTTGVARGRDRLNSPTSTSAIKENDIVRLAPR